MNLPGIEWYVSLHVAALGAPARSSVRIGQRVRASDRDDALTVVVAALSRRGLRAVSIVETTQLEGGV